MLWFTHSRRAHQMIDVDGGRSPKPHNPQERKEGQLLGCGTLLPDCRAPVRDSEVRRPTSQLSVTRTPVTHATHTKRNARREMWRRLRASCSLATAAAAIRLRQNCLSAFLTPLRPLSPSPSTSSPSLHVQTPPPRPATRPPHITTRCPPPATPPPPHTSGSGSSKRLRSKVNVLLQLACRWCPR